MPPTNETRTDGASPLRRGLSQRQLNMIALGGVIGAGLFVGSGVIIEETGPGAFITYALCGVLVVLVMRMLGEMATAHPSTGSFADYARQALGGWAGFSVGWLYWYFWVVVVGFEAIAGGAVLSYWIKAPLWLLSLVLMVAMTATNLFSVAAFGEFEFWFAGIKVAAIVVFLALGSLFVLGAWPRHGIDFSNLTAHGGFFPNGVGAIFGAVSVVIGAMVGAEVATIAAAETADPERAVARATKSVVVRIVIFYLGSVFLLAVIVPWNAQQPGISPYVAALSDMGIPFAGHIMNAVVLTAVLSCLNSGLYTASRMLFVLAGPPRSSDESGQGGSTRGALRGHRLLVARGLSLRGDGVDRTRRSVHLSAEIIGFPCAFGLPADRSVADRAAPPDAAGSAAGEDVALSRHCRCSPRWRSSACWC